MTRTLSSFLLAPLALAAACATPDSGGPYRERSTGSPSASQFATAASVGQRGGGEAYLDCMAREGWRVVQR
jgi:hypothetical protein